MKINFVSLLSSFAQAKYNLFIVLTNAIRRMFVAVVYLQIYFVTDFLYFGGGKAL